MATSGAHLQLVEDRTQAQHPVLSKEPLWRHLLGGRFRTLRHERGETLVQTAQRAGVSSQYLSEVERGVKEPSSEVIAAVARALGVTLLDLTVSVASDIRSTQTRVGHTPAGVAHNASSFDTFAMAA